MKKRLISLILLFLLVAPIFVFAQEDHSCSGWFGWMKCFLTGNPDNRAGKSWFDRGAVVGESMNQPTVNYDGTDYITMGDPSGPNFMVHEIKSDGAPGDMVMDSRIVEGVKALAGAAGATTAPPAPAAAPAPAAPAAPPGEIYTDGKGNEYTKTTTDGTVTWKKGDDEITNGGVIEFLDEQVKNKQLNKKMKMDGMDHGTMSSMPGATVNSFPAGDMTIVQSGEEVATIPTVVYQQFSAPGMITGVSGDKVQLKDGGYIETKKEGEFTSTTVKVGNEYTSTTWSVGNRPIEGSWEYKNGKLENTDKDTISAERTGDVTTITRMNAEKDGEKTAYNDNDGSTEVTELDDEKPVSYVKRDKSGTVIATSDKFEDDKPKELEYLYPNGELKGYCPEGNCVDDNKRGFWFVDGDTACYGKKEDCFDKGVVKPSSTTESTEEVIEEGDCDNDVCREAFDRKETDLFFNLKGGFWEIASGETRPQQILGGIFGFRPGWESLSAWWAPDLTREWMKRASKKFDKAMLAEYIVPRAVCKFDEKSGLADAHLIAKDGQRSLFLEYSPGAAQHAASITAEKTPEAGPTLCSEELPCTKGECKDGLCYEGKTVLQSIFYKITWAVSAPVDESFTPYLDENGVAIKYNIKLTGGPVDPLWLYPAVGGDQNTLKLVNGESDRDTYISYSPNNYKTACIVFGAPPKDLSGETIDQPFCVTIIPSTDGVVKWRDAGEPGSTSGGSSTESSYTVSDAGRKQI